MVDDAHFFVEDTRFGHLVVDEGILRIEADDAMVFYVDERRVAIDNRHAEVGVEAQFERTRFQIAVPIGRFTAEAEVPFADTGCRISRPLHDVGDSRSVRIDDETSLEENRWPEIDSEWVLACQ